MLAFLFSFLTAIFESITDVFSKKSLAFVDEYIVSWSIRFLALPFLIPFIVVLGMPILGGQFFIALLIGGSLNVLTTILYMKALKSSDLSISVPMLAFTPLFLLITSPFIVGEFPDIFGLIGVLLIVVGSYVLNIKEFAGGWLSPFRVLLKERGPQLMLIVAFLWSITSNFDKVGVQNSSPFFWALIINLFIAVALFPILILRSSEPGNFKKNLDKLIPVGLFSAITIIFQMTAINLTLVAYVIAIKRTSIIFSVLWGHYIFKEEGVRERLIGVMIMILGAFFITISSLS